MKNLKDSIFESIKRNNIDSEKLKEFQYIIKQTPNERYLEQMEKDELELFKGFALFTSKDSCNLNSITCKRCKEWYELAVEELEWIEKHDVNESIDEPNKEKIERAASQWAKDNNYGKLGVKLVMTAYFGTAQEYEKVEDEFRKEYEFDPEKMMEFETKYLFK